MNKVDSLIREAYRNLVSEEGPGGVEDLAQQGMGVDPSEDIAAPDPEQAGVPDEKPAPLTSKGEEYLLKLAYLALLYTPKEAEMLQIKNTFESSGIHDETAIRAEEPETIANVKNILVNLIGSNDSTQIADQLNDLPGDSI
jgi:hypothetical protein